MYLVGGKNATTSNSAVDSCIPFPVSSVQNFRARNERREASREGNGQSGGEGRYEGIELASRTEMYFRHPGAHVRHPDPTQLTLRPESCNTVTLRAVVTSRTPRTVVTLRP